MSARLVVLACGVLALASVAWGQGVVTHVFSLDDNPAMPMTSPPGPIPGFGAESPFGLPIIPPPGLAPSPTLPVIPAPDAMLLMPPAAGGPFPVMHVPPPGPAYLDAFSAQKKSFTTVMALDFSVDRQSMGFGMPPSAMSIEAGFFQQAGDIYRSTVIWRDPGMFCGMLGPGPFAGFLPTAGMMGSNTLVVDESVLGLTALGAPGALVPPGVPTPPPGPGGALKDNVDAYERYAVDINGDGLNDVWMYFSINPDMAVMAPGTSAADIFDVAPGMGGTGPVPYAPAITMGLDLVQGPNTDDIDALVMWDVNILGGPMWGGPGAEPGIDYALFSLSPGSASLAAFGLSPGDILFTDFTGAFAVFAFAGDVGMGMGMFAPDNMDALCSMIFLAGDCDLDGDVDFADYQALETNFGTGSTWQQGDFDGDGDVDFADYQALETNFGKSVPEPATLVLLALGLGVLRIRRR